MLKENIFLEQNYVLKYDIEESNLVDDRF